MRYFLELVLQRLVDHPEEIDVRQVDGDRHVAFHVSVHPDDVGKVIGKSGRTINAIRGVLNAVAARQDQRVSVELFDNAAA
ncbi:MAG: KH domain-containing protein [Verrucomicrobium sp.]|nr:KH domain-containing protein [Verrucomicrobium sp.]